jgi:hypothetical protein
MAKKLDPVGEEFYEPLRRADIAGAVLFYISAVLSLLAIWIAKDTYPTAYESIQIAFALSVVALFGTGLAIRLYFFPRAQARRYQDFLAHAFDRPLSYKQTVDYYNNSATAGPIRVAAQVLESSFFSMEILAKMVTRERVKVLLYAALWLIIIFHRNSDLALIGVAAQILFSEQILSRWFRMEWFRWQSEKIHGELLTLFRSRAEFDVAAWESLGRYEIAKATSCISLSTNIFANNRDRLNGEWKKMRATLSI